jgi:phosphoribosylformimino-5-aminoimidazole carboxamide ribotide isomerase
VLARRHRELEIIPAVDVLAGRAVRLERGQPEHVTAEGGDPAALAQRWADDGATRIHLVDLDGAIVGKSDPALVARVAEIGVPVQVGGGLRTLNALEAALEAGADRVIVGTAALQPGFLPAAVERFGEALVVAVDARDGRVAVEGWQRTVSDTPVEVARRYAAAGVIRILVTSANRDGTLAGPDLGLLGDILGIGPPVLAAGGIGKLDDLVALRGLGCEAAVVGSALLHSRFSLGDAQAAALVR